MPGPVEEEPLAHEPVDPDTGTDRVAAAPIGREVLDIWRTRWDVLLVIAAGGVVGSAARWGVEVLLPARSGSVPWGTLVVNVAGAFLLGLLMHYVVNVWRPSRYARPFLGVGVLGGFTTFSTYAVEVRDLAAGGHAPLGAAYLLGTLALGLPAAFGGSLTGRALAGRTPS